MRRTLASQKFHALMGPPSKFKFSGFQQKISLWNAGSGGLATIARTHQPIKHIAADGAPFTSGKCMITWIPSGIGRRGFYIFNIYGYVGAGSRNPTAMKDNEELLQQVFEHAATFGEVPILLIGDFQTNPLESKILGTLIANKSFFDLGALLTGSDWTFQKGDDTNIRTRIDLALCNQIMLPFLKNLEVVQDSGIPAHRPLKISLAFSKFLDAKFVYRSPKAVSLPVHCPRYIENLDSETWNKQQSEWNSLSTLAVADADPQTHMNNLFDKWTKTAESFILKAANVHGPQYQGRGRRPKLITKTIQAPPASEPVGAATVKLLSLLKLRRRFSQLQKKNPNMDSGTAAHSQFLELQSNCLASWRRLLSHKPLPSLDTCQSLVDATGVIDEEISLVQQSTAEKRLQTFKEKLIEDWKGDKKATYRWLRDTEPCVTPIFQTATHEFAVKHQELHDLMYQAWFPIFNRFIDNPELSFDLFLQLFPNCIPGDFPYSADSPLALEDITPEQVSTAIHKLKTSEPGADAWQVQELKYLGKHSVCALAQLFNLIETSGCWPQLFHEEIPVAALKKPSGSAAKDIRPIALASLIYRLWAKIRWADLQDWRLSWLPQELKGGAKNREAVDAYYELMLEVENSLHSKHPLFGIMYDYTKCFDYIPWSIELGLLRTLGLPQRIAKPLFAFSKNLRRRFKLGNSLGPVLQNTNSIMQGCPLAILRILSLLRGLAPFSLTVIPPFVAFQHL